MCATQYSPKIVTDGLVLCLDAANTKSYPGSGTTWTDLSGNGNHATLYNSPTFTQPKAGYSSGITCNGTNQYILNTSLPGGDSTFTIECIFYHNGSDQGASYGVVSWGNNYGPLFYNHNGGTGGHYFRWSPGGDYPGGMGWTINDWNHHVSIFRNCSGSSDDFDLWLNGAVQVNGKSFDIHNSGSGRGSNGYLLSGYTAGSNPFKGSYGILRYYNRALTDAEVIQNYNSTKSRFGL